MCRILPLSEQCSDRKQMVLSDPSVIYASQEVTLKIKRSGGSIALTGDASGVIKLVSKI